MSISANVKIHFISKYLTFLVTIHTYNITVTRYNRRRYAPALKCLYVSKFSFRLAIIIRLNILENQ